jgi:ABC-type multidrug transport system fused ATPase/permease subunit
VDGVDVRELSIRSLRRHIAFVLQDTQLFHATVWQNIAYGRQHATREEIEEAARLAHADEFIRAMPDGYETVVGPGGVGLSGGQRQRLGIARALVRNASIVILDEPSAALDHESERLVFDGLRRLLAGRTTFVIAHRASATREVDRVLTLDGGQLTELGSG